MDLDDLAFLLGDDAPSEGSGPEYRNIWVLAERQGDGLHRVTRQVMGKARELADRLGARVEAVLLGYEADAVANALVRLGADRVFYVDDSRLQEPNGDSAVQALARLINDRRPEIVLSGFTPFMKEVAPRLAQRLGTGLVADATQLDLDENERQLIATRASFGGRALATVTCPKARPQMATVHPNAFSEAEPDASRDGEVERVSVDDLAEPRVRVTGHQPMPAEVPLERARVLVVGGKGLGGAEGAQLVQQLAAALGGQAAGTRGAVEAGWFDASREVSGRGATVAPDLYIGVGVSGSMDHIDAMRQSRTIVAINTNPDAPLMELADTALVGDLREVLPALLEAVQALRDRRAAVAAR